MTRQIETNPSMHDTAYFDSISKALVESGIHFPALVVDLDRLDHNLALINDRLAHQFDVRLVAKSLPCLGLIQYIQAATHTSRLMSFHLPFLHYLIQHNASDDYLLGKPMPVGGVREFYRQIAHERLSPGFDPFSQIQWLVDDFHRLSDYIALGQDLGKPLQVNLEVNIGLNRGGFSNTSDLRRALQYIQQSNAVSLSGLMGYEAHISKAKGPLSNLLNPLGKASKTYGEFVDCIRDAGINPHSLCLNTGGSTTYNLYTTENTVANELALGSVLVKPTDFDLPNLADHLPAAFIAAPVLKMLESPSLPIIGTPANRMMSKLGLMPKHAAFIYGGNWMASPCYPSGTKQVTPYGHSSNQELYSIDPGPSGKRPDHIFFRPAQSEAVLLQFGSVLGFRQGVIETSWPVFSYPKHPNSMREDLPK